MLTVPFAAQIGTLTSTEVQAFTTTQANALTSTQLRGLTTTVLGNFSTGQIDALIVQNPFKMGYEGVKAVAMAIKGQPVEKKMDTGVAVVTKDALDKPEIKALLNIQ